MRTLVLFDIWFLVIGLLAVFALSIEIKEYFPDERDALMKMRDVMNSSNLHSNWTGPPCHNNQSRWGGVACFNGHITRLVLENIHLIGSLPPGFLQNITFLSKLSFRNNSLHGILPNVTNLAYLEFVLLSHNNFSGSIPLEYIQLPRLKKLELQENSLNGSIPPFDQQTLIALNVSYNRLDGPIPATRVLQRFPKNSFDHNANLCGSLVDVPCPIPPPPPPPPAKPAPSPIPSHNTKKRSLKLWNIILIAAAAAFIPLFVMILFFCYHRRAQGQGTEEEQQESELEKKRRYWPGSPEDPEKIASLQFFDHGRIVFELDDLLRASAEVMGKGKLGTTYKAMLDSGPVVVVKRFKEMNALSKKEFTQQMHLLERMRHENLVEIISFYCSKEEKLIIYEFVPNGNLYDLLHENRGVGRVPLSWNERLSIIQDIAKGLTFLHQSLPSHKVPHANLKASNVLIKRNNQNCHAKLTDFGLWPLLTSRNSSKELAVGRTPEFLQGKRLTFKADVYCFGIILLEVITGKIPHSEDVENGDDLSDWVRNVVNNDWSTDILDVEIVAAKEGHEDMLKLTQLAFECTDMSPEKRPKMSEVLRRIEDI